MTADWKRMAAGAAVLMGAAWAAQKITGAPGLRDIYGGQADRPPAEPASWQDVGDGRLRWAPWVLGAVAVGGGTWWWSSRRKSPAAALRAAKDLVLLSGASEMVIEADGAPTGAVDPALLQVSPTGLDLLRYEEGVRTQLYNDSAGYCTIGVGHLVHRSPCDGSEPSWMRDGLTDQEVDQLLREDLNDAQYAVRTHVTVPLTQNQFDALVSLAFNIGGGAFAGSTLVRRLNDGDYDAVPAEMAKWRKAGGQVSAVLERRRRVEAALFAAAGPVNIAALSSAAAYAGVV